MVSHTLDTVRHDCPSYPCIGTRVVIPENPTQETKCPVPAPSPRSPPGCLGDALPASSPSRMGAERAAGFWLVNQKAAKTRNRKTRGQNKPLAAARRNTKRLLSVFWRAGVSDRILKLTTELVQWPVNMTLISTRARRNLFCKGPFPTMCFGIFRTSAWTACAAGSFTHRSAWCTSFSTVNPANRNKSPQACDHIQHNHIQHQYKVPHTRVVETINDRPHGPPAPPPANQSTRCSTWFHQCFGEVLYKLQLS